MNVSISTYQVQREDTLASVADKLGISAEELKRYHNTYCDLKSLIGNDLRGVREILVPPSEKIAEIKKLQKNSESFNTLPSSYLTKDFYFPFYHAKEEIRQAERENLNLAYSVSIKLREAVEKGFAVEVSTSDFKKNGKSPDDKIETLSIACMDCISPLVFRIPAQGKIRGFYDHKTLMKTFESKRKDLEDFFIGEVNSNYLEKFRVSISKEAYLMKQFRSALMYQVLFPEMECLRRKSEWEESFYPVSGSFPVKCRFHTEYDFEDPETVQIHLKGTFENSSGLQELLRGSRWEEKAEEPLNGKVEITYTTTKKSRKLRKVKAVVQLFYKGACYQEHLLELIAGEKSDKE